MKKLICLLFLSFMLSIAALGQSTRTLTAKQKANDFEYLYQAVKENYPFLHVNERLYGVDWMANKQQYLRQLTHTATDSAYIFTLKQIIADLHNGHVSFNPTLWYSSYLQAYKKIVGEGSTHYITWVDVLSKNEGNANYWASLLKKEQKTEESTSKEAPKANVTYKIIDGDIAVIEIGTFNTFMIKKDSIVIVDFFKTISGCHNLIIDIRRNGGGDTRYWENNIVRPLLKKPIEYSVYGVIKDGELNRQFYSHFFQQAKRLTSEYLRQNMPAELLFEAYYIKEDIDTLLPYKNSLDFNGRIFVATSGEVFSASESFSAFCKQSGWATLIGEQTAGNGAGGDPIIISLPESGILITMPTQQGINPDGSFNAETKTQPDVEIKAENYDKQMERIVEYVKGLK